MRALPGLSCRRTMPFSGWLCLAIGLITESSRRTRDFRLALVSLTLTLPMFQSPRKALQS